MDKQRIGFIGLGNMGLGMASRLAESGYEIAVYNRTRSKADPVAELGARVADSPAEAARDAHVLMLSLANQDAVRAMLFGDDGAVAALPEGAYVVDMSTVPPDFARELAVDGAAVGTPGARRMRLRSADARAQRRAQGHGRRGRGGLPARSRTSSETIGKEVTFLGVNGMGATMKLVLNMLMGVQMPALAEAIVFGERAGLRREDILNMIAGSGYSSPVMTFRCGFIGRRAFENAAFRLSLMRKDMMLVLAESQGPQPFRCRSRRAPTRCSRPPSSRASATWTWPRSSRSWSGWPAWTTIRGPSTGRTQLRGGQ